MELFVIYFKIDGVLLYNSFGVVDKVISEGGTQRCS